MSSALFGSQAAPPPTSSRTTHASAASSPAGWRLLCKSGIYLVSTLINKGMGFILLPLYARYLSPTDFGILALATAFGSIVQSLYNLGLQDAVSRFYFKYQHDQAELRECITTAFVAILGVSVVLCLAVVAASSAIATAVIDSGGVRYILLATGIAFWAQFPDLLRILLINRGQPFWFALLTSGQAGLVAALTLWYVVFRGAGAQGALWAQFVAGAIVAGLAIWPMRKVLCLRLSWQKLRAMLVYGLPYVPHILSGWVIVYLDRFLLKHFYTLASVGIYSIGFSIASVMSLVTAGFMQSWAPFTLGRLEQEGKAAHAKLAQFALVAVGVLAGAAVGLSLVSRDVIVLMFPARYESAASVVPILVASHLFAGLNQMAMIGTMYAGRTGYFPLVTTTSMVIMVALNIALIPRLGVIGAAIAMLVSAATTFTLNYRVAARVYPIPYSTARSAAVLGGGATIILLGSLLTTAPLLLDFAVKGFLLLCFIGALIWTEVLPRSTLMRISCLGRGGGRGVQ